ncbi:MAG: aminofutalosine synthase MqnE, partial [Pedobacter sp.]
MNTTSTLSVIIKDQDLPEQLRLIAQKVSDQKRITFEEGVYLFEHAELGYLGALANHIRERKHGDKTYFNKNFHLEPTNLCVYDCKFCSYSRLIKQKDEGWALTLEEMLDVVKKYDGEPVTEVHIVGGVLPQYDVAFYSA